MTVPTVPQRIFAHAGDLGDVIWALPAIRAAGGGTLNLHPADRTRLPMTAERADGLRRLLEHQDYIDEVVWTREPLARAVDLNGFRQHIRENINLAECHCRFMGISAKATTTAWLTVKPIPHTFPVLFNRTQRYGNPFFNWRDLYQKYGRHAAFVGHPDEHRAFETAVGPMPYMKTADLYEFAQVVATCRLFVCNQSCPHTIAEGLKRDIVLIADPVQQVCVFRRPGVTTFQQAGITLPEIPL